MTNVPHFEYSGNNGAYLIWQVDNGSTHTSVGTMERCSDMDYSCYGVPRAHKWRVDARALGHTVTATGVNRDKALAEWCRLLRQRTAN